VRRYNVGVIRTHNCSSSIPIWSVQTRYVYISPSWRIGGYKNGNTYIYVLYNYYTVLPHRTVYYCRSWSVRLLTRVCPPNTINYLLFCDLVSDFHYGFCDTYGDDNCSNCRLYVVKIRCDFQVMAYATRVSLKRSVRRLECNIILCIV
jgi:hypothetical protein